MVYTNKHVQFFLHCWYGAYDGEYDGIIGPKTKEAIKKFQKDKELVVDGIWGEKTEGKAIEWTRAVETWLYKNRYMKQKDAHGVPWVAFERGFWAWEDEHKFKRTAVMTSEKLKIFQKEDLPDLKNFYVKGVDEHNIVISWTRPISGLTTNIYETNSTGSEYRDRFGYSTGWMYTVENLPTGVTKYYRVSAYKDIDGHRCWTKYTKVDYGTTRSNALKNLRYEIDWWKEHPPWDSEKWRYMCESWCAKVYRDAGLKYGGYCCAGNHRIQKANTSTIVPNGALVYSSPNYHNSICGDCGNWNGHIGIYLDGKVYSSQSPFGMDFFTWKDIFGFGGWSTEGNF